MHQMIFVNLPVADPLASKRFFGALGYSFNDEMCDDQRCTAVELGPNIYAMLLRRDFFDSFHDDQSRPGEREAARPERGEGGPAGARARAAGGEGAAMLNKLFGKPRDEGASNASAMRGSSNGDAMVALERLNETTEMLEKRQKLIEKKVRRARARGRGRRAAQPPPRPAP